MDMNRAAWVSQNATAAGPGADADRDRFSAAAPGSTAARAAGFSHEASDAFGAIGSEAADPSLQEKLWQAAIPDLRRLWQRP